MKMQGPEGISSLSVNGIEVVLDSHGCAEVDKSVAAELRAHGFSEAVAPATEPEAEPAAAEKKASSKPGFGKKKE